MLKTLIVALFTVLSLSCFSQSKAKADTLVTDSTNLISIADYSDFYDAVMKKLPLEYGDQVRNWWIQRIQYKAELYKRRKL